MKRGMIFTGCILALALSVFAPHTGAQTSPYLLGEWEMFRVLYDKEDGHRYEVPFQTQFKIINPNTTDLSVYAVLLDRYGNPAYDDNTNPPTLICYSYQLKSNATWKPCFPFFDAEDNLVWPNEKHKYGAVKFFAFPSGTTKYDPNAVIGGFQQKWSWMYTYGYDYYYRWDFYYWDPLGTEAPVLAVTINSKTIGEFAKYPLNSCQPWRTWRFECADNYFEEEY